MKTHFEISTTSPTNPTAQKIVGMAHGRRIPVSLSFSLLFFCVRWVYPTDARPIQMTHTTWNALRRVKRRPWAGKYVCFKDHPSRPLSMRFPKKKEGHSKHASRLWAQPFGSIVKLLPGFPKPERRHWKGTVVATHACVSFKIVLGNSAIDIYKSLTWTVTIKMTSVVAPFFQSLTISSSSRPFFNCCPKSPSKESSQNACNIWYIWQYIFQYINIYISCQDFQPKESSQNACNICSCWL